jgi:hypothetical protein
MLGLSRFRKTAAVIAGVGATVALVGVVASANGFDPFVHLCSSSQSGQVFTAGNSSCDTALDILQPSAVAVTKDENTVPFPSGSDYHTIVGYQVAPGIYQFKAKTNLVVASGPEEETQTDCQLTYQYAGTGAVEIVADRTSQTDENIGATVAETTFQSRSVHNFEAVLDFSQQTQPVTVQIECRVLFPLTTSTGTVTFTANNSKIIGDQLAVYSDIVS